MFFDFDMQQHPQQQQQWTATKSVVTFSSSATVNALSTAETNMNASYSSNGGVSRSAQPHKHPHPYQPSPQQQLHRQMSASFSLELGGGSSSGEEYPVSVYSVIDRIVHEVTHGASSPRPDESSTASSSPINITPRGGNSPLHPVPPVRLQRQHPIFQECHSSSAQPSDRDSSSMADMPHSGNVVAPSLGPSTGFISYHDPVTPVWEPLSKQSSLQPELSGPVPRTTPCVGLPRPLSIAAVSAVNNCSYCHHNDSNSSAYVSGSSTPAHQPPYQQSSQQQPASVTPASYPDSGGLLFPASSSNSHGNMEVVITGAIAAGATPTSNAVTHYKTKRCRHFDLFGSCPYQHRCVFAHGERELGLYTARKNEATSGMNLKTSQQMRDHIARNVHQLVEEYELATAEAAALAKAKSATAAAIANAVAAAQPHSSSSNAATVPATNSAMTAVTSLSSAQSASQVSSATSQHSSVHLVAASPLAPGLMLAPAASANSNVQVLRYQPQQQQPQLQAQQQQQSYTMLRQQPIYLTPANPNGVDASPLHFTSRAPVGTAFTVVSAPAPMQAAPQSLYVGNAQPPLQQQQPQPQYQQQQQLLLTVQSSVPGVYHLQPAQSLSPPQQQQQQQIFVLDGPFFRAVQMNSSTPRNRATSLPQAQSSSNLHSYPSGGYVGSNGTAYDSSMMIGRYT
jgi:hypothetical protein